MFVTILSNSHPQPQASHKEVCSVPFCSWYTVYVNDVPDTIHDSHLKLFADAAQIYHPIKQPNDTILLRNVLDKLHM